MRAARSRGSVAPLSVSRSLAARMRPPAFTRAALGKALGIGTGTVQRVLMEQPRPFGVRGSA